MSCMNLKWINLPDAEISALIVVDKTKMQCRRCLDVHVTQMDSKQNADDNKTIISVRLCMVHLLTCVLKVPNMLWIHLSHP